MISDAEHTKIRKICTRELGDDVMGMSLNSAVKFKMNPFTLHAHTLAAIITLVVRGHLIIKSKEPKPKDPK